MDRPANLLSRGPGCDTRVSLSQDFILTATSGEAVFVRYDFEFDLNGEVNVDDIDALVRRIIAVHSGDEPDPSFDLTGNGIVDVGDRDQWLTAAASASGFAEPYLLGDATWTARSMRRT